MALKAICPQVHKMQYNEGTLGDICEAWLAIGMRSAVPSARSLATRLEGVVSHLYIVVDELNIWTLAGLDDRCSLAFEADF